VDVTVAMVDVSTSSSILENQVNTETIEPVTAFTSAHNNAELIVQCRRLGYLRDEWLTLDPTYGHGKFWTLWRPRCFIGSDIKLDKSPVGRSVDFTALRYQDATFDAVVFDPPYKLNGTSTGKGPAASDEGYGVDGAYVRWQGRHDLIRRGITECVRVLKPNGMLLVKCQDQVCSGQKRWQTREFAAHAESLGCRLVDMLHLPGGRKQPPGRRQLHALQNFSTMLVLQKEAGRGRV
jgi:hypothetical protein